MFNKAAFADMITKPFILEKTLTVDALKNMGGALGKEVHSLLVYYGENPDSPEAPKPEDFFNWSFLSLLHCRFVIVFQNHVRSS